MYCIYCSKTDLFDSPGWFCINLWGKHYIHSLHLFFTLPLTESVHTNSAGETIIAFFFLSVSRWWQGLARLGSGQLQWTGVVAAILSRPMVVSCLLFLIVFIVYHFLFYFFNTSLVSSRSPSELWVIPLGTICGLVESGYKRFIKSVREPSPTLTDSAGMCLKVCESKGADIEIGTMTLFRKLCNCDLTSSQLYVGKRPFMLRELAFHPSD